MYSDVFQNTKAALVERPYYYLLFALIVFRAASSHPYPAHRFPVILSPGIDFISSAAPGAAIKQMPLSVWGGSGDLPITGIDLFHQFYPIR
jgi:hypothetical protein